MNVFNCKLTKLPKVSCIYKITCVQNERFYIGSAISFRKRVKDHRNSLLRNEHSSYKLQKDFNELGKDVFEIEIIVNFNIIYERKILGRNEKNKWQKMMYQKV